MRAVNTSAREVIRTTTAIATRRTATAVVLVTPLVATRIVRRAVAVNARAVILWDINPVTEWPVSAVALVTCFVNAVPVVNINVQELIPGHTVRATARRTTVPVTVIVARAAFVASVNVSVASGTSKRTELVSAPVLTSAKVITVPVKIQRAVFRTITVNVTIRKATGRVVSITNTISRRPRDLRIPDRLQ